MMVWCLDCDRQAIDGAHKGNHVRRCPDCGEILYRPVATAADDPDASARTAVPDGGHTHE